MDQYDVQNLKRETCRIIFVISTFATGDFPDSAQGFWKNLQKGDWNATSLSHMEYTIFGLGSSHAVEHYNAAAKMLDKRLLELGAKHFYIVGLGNELDEDSHDTAFIPWCNGLKVKMRGIYKASSSSTLATPTSPTSPTSPSFPSPLAPFSSSHSVPQRLPSDDALNPGHALPYSIYMLPDQRTCVPGYTMVQMLSNTLITPKDFEKGVYYCEFSLEDTPLRYKLCDYVAVLPRNKRSLVDGFLAHLNLSGEATVVITPQHGGVPLKVPQPIRLSELFESYIDLFSQPTKYLMSIFAAYATNEEEKKVLQKISASHNNADWELFHREQYTIADVLLSYSSIRFGLAELISYVPLIKPRLYSICSNPKEYSHKLSFVYSHRSWRTPSGRSIKGGVCTNFLTHVNPMQEPIAVSIKRGTIKFSKKEVENPIVFMALGTGVGSAVAIMRERRNLQQQGLALGPMVLYFSVRNKEKDFIFEEELNSYLACGVLTNLVTTFAYDTQPPQFIQVRIKEDPALLWSYLDKPKCKYIYCGLGGSIPDEIEEEIKNVLPTVAGLSLEGVAEHISKMKQEKRWIVENHTSISLKAPPVIDILQSTELHEELTFSQVTSKVSGGTPRRLVEWISSKGDIFDIASLLLTYRKYLDTVDLLHIFRDLYSASIEAADVKTINNLLLFLRQWATHYYRADFRSNELKQEFWQVVETMAIPKHDLTHSLGGVLTREGSQSLSHMSSASASSSSSSVSLASPSSKSLTDLKEKKLHRLSKHFLVTDFDEEMVFAELDFRLCSEFAQILPLELVDVSWQKKDKDKLAPNVLRLIASFNEISGWVATEVLSAPSPKQQTGCIVHFIKIASIAVEKRNFDLVMAILSGLTNYSVSRCHSLWDNVPAKIKDRFAAVQDVMKIDSNFKRYRELLHAAPAMPYFDHKRKQSFLIHLQHPMFPPAVPYMALILRDLAFAEENADYFENGLINFEKSRILYTIVQDVQNLQRIPNPPNTGSGNSTPNRTALNLKEFLKNMEVLDDQELYTHSVVIEPARQKARSSSKLDFFSQVGVSLFNNCMANNVNAVKNLLKENNIGDVVKYTNQHGETALHVCAAEGFTKLVRILLESGADVNVQNNAGNTALHLASSNNHLKSAKVLVENGADLMKTNEEKKTAIEVATPRVQSYLEVERLRPLLQQIKSKKAESAIIWNETMSVGVKLFDNDHKQLIDAINLVLSLNSESGDYHDSISNVLDFLLYYTEFHFANEETLFAKYNYPQTTPHKKEHIRLTEQVKQYNKLHRKGKVTNQELTKFLQGWLINHIMKEDMKYTDFFHTKGVF